MRDLVQWMNDPRDVHPVIASAIAQFQLVHIHPFLDGDGRTLRLPTVLCLDRAGYAPRRTFEIGELEVRDRTAVCEANQRVRRVIVNVTLCIKFFTRGLASQRAEVMQRGEHAMRQDVRAATPWRAAGDGSRRRPGPRPADSRRRSTPMSGNSASHPATGLRVLTATVVLRRRGRTNRVEYLLARGAACAQVGTRANLAPELAPPACARDASPQRARRRQVPGRPLESSVRTSR